MPYSARQSTPSWPANPRSEGKGGAIFAIVLAAIGFITCLLNIPLTFAALVISVISKRKAAKSGAPKTLPTVAIIVTATLFFLSVTIWTLILAPFPASNASKNQLSEANAYYLQNLTYEGWSPSQPGFGYKTSPDGETVCVDKGNGIFAGHAFASKGFHTDSSGTPETPGGISSTGGTCPTTITITSLNPGPEPTKTLR